jgi:hypothetical protein
MSDRYGGSRSRGSSRQWNDTPAAYNDGGGRGRGGSQSRRDAWDDSSSADWVPPSARNRSRQPDYGRQPDYERRPARTTTWDDEPPAGRSGGSWAGAGGLPAPRDWNDRGGGRAKPRGRGPLVLLLGGLVLVILVVGGLFAYSALANKGGHSTTPVADDPYTAPTGPTPTVSPNFKAFASDRSKYSITYPSAWNASSDERKVQSQYDYIDKFELQNAPSRLLVEQAGAFLTYTDNEILKAEASNAQQGGVTVTEIANATGTPASGTPASSTPTPTASGTPAPPAAAKVTVGGATWLRRDYQVNASGTPMRMTILACHHGGRGYVIIMASSASEYGNDDQAVFQPMLKSFRFAS